MSPRPTPPEDISLDAEQQAVYDETLEVLRSSTDFEFYGSVSSVVGIPDPATVAATTTTTMVTPTRGHVALGRVLDDLEGLDKQEAALVRDSPLSAQCMGILTREAFADSAAALHALRAAGRAVPRRVCQHPFRKNDIVWVCRTCQADETCVLCHSCFSQSDHEGHDVAFYHAQAGGCCDCGDPDAWDPAGFCPHHGPRRQQQQQQQEGSSTAAATVSPLPAGAGSPTADDDDRLADLPHGWVHRVRGLVPAMVDWLVTDIAHTARTAFARAHDDWQSDDEEEEESDPDDDGDVVPMATSSVEDHIVDNQNEAGTGNDPTATATTSTQHIPGIRDGTMGFDMRAASGVQRPAIPSPAAAQALGQIGAAGRGLYLVWHADDIHAVPQTVDALREFLGTANYYTDSLLQKFTAALRSNGQLVVWGLHEMMQQAGATSVQLWMDGDAAQSARMGALMLERAAKLTRHGLFCSILTRDELIAEQRAVAALQWLSEVAKSCDPLCQTVAECILPNRHLVPLLRADFKMNARVTKAWYSLLLTLLAVPTFKSHLAAAYCDTYRNVTAKYARGMGVLERSGYTLSVQFLNRVTYVVDLVRGRGLLGKLGKSLLETLLVSRKGTGLDPMHFVLTHRRYSPCISDLKCVLNVKGMPRLFACKGGTFLFDWIKTLSLAQQMDPQTWRHWTQGHIEDESRGWVGAFNASISLGSLFERLLGWEDEEASPITDPTSPLSKDLMPCSELTCTILVHGVHKWHNQGSHLYQPTPFSTMTEPHRRCPVSLPLSHIARLAGSRLAMRHMCVAQSSPISFHLPLHRFAATCVRELCLRRDGAGSLLDLFGRIAATLSPVECNDLFMRLMEFPLLVLTRAAQVRAGLWRRNGPGLNDQVLNYAEPPFCRTMRDADLLLVQFAVLGRKEGLGDESSVGMVYFVHLLLHKLGIFDFCGLLTAPSQDIPLYLQEAEAGFYAKELPSTEGASGSQVILPWTYTPSRELASSLVLLEEFLRMLTVFASELPHPPPSDKTEHTEQARWRLHREVVHRLASGPKTHSELLEVHHVLSHWDNMLLSEEGKEVNPDDATGAALGTVLSEVADRKVSRGKLEPDKWEMRRSAWDLYDPSFFHISVRMHQSAADSRPKPKIDAKALFGLTPKSYSPEPYAAHPFFVRLRRDVMADATVISILYRVLHMHLRSNPSKDTDGLPGSEAYQKEKSETALARAVHLLTLGVFAWRNAFPNDPSWKEKGGGSAGSIFFDWTSTDSSPTSSDWVNRVLLGDPSKLTACPWYDGEECLLELLHHLAKNGRGADGFLAQDSSVRAGAAWICQFGMSVSSEAALRLQPKKSVSSAVEAPKKESDVDMRRRLAREKAMSKMKAQAAKFASMMDVDMEEGDEASRKATEDCRSGEIDATAPRTPERPVRASSFGSAHSSASSMNSDFGGMSGIDLVGQETPSHDPLVAPQRLLRQRPRCIICNDEESTEIRSIDRGEVDDGEGQRKRSRKKTDNALGFVGYIQASTVMKGGGGTPPKARSIMTPTRGHCGSHVALCGHAVHSECCESYLATVSHREDRAIGKRDEFRCPLCQRLSNCLVPFIDVGSDWVEAPSFLPQGKRTPGAVKSDAEVEPAEGTPEGASPVSLHEYLVGTPWWVTKQDTGIAWDGHSAFVDRHASIVPEDTNPSHNRRRSTQRRGVRPLTKRDLYAAWNAMMKTPRFVRRRLRSRGHQQEEGHTPERETSAFMTEPTESTGESVVWRRFMDQVSDISYRADSRRLGDETLHENFGEFRHYIKEKFAYNCANRFVAGDPTEWPHCIFNDTLSDLQRQEMSREKLLSKLFLSIQAFTYSCCCETFEAKRTYLKSVLSSSTSASLRPDSSTDFVLSAFGIVGVACNGQLILMPHPRPDVDDGSHPFSGRLGKLRYLGLAVMAAAGPVAADLVQLALAFPIMTEMRPRGPSDGPKPERAPIAYPLLLGHVLTHVVAAMCATCGRGRARSDSLELAWPAPFSQRGSFFSMDPGFPGKDVDSVIQDCEGFMKLGLVARILQVLLARLNAPTCGFPEPSYIIASLAALRTEFAPGQDAESKWTKSCVRLLELALTNRRNSVSAPRPATDFFTLETLKEASSAALCASCEFLSEAGSILQVLVPGVLVSYESTPDPVSSLKQNSSPMETFERLRFFLKLEQLDEMLTSPLTQDIVANWYDDAVRIGKEASSEGRNESSTQQALHARLKKTEGFRDRDWPSAGSTDLLEMKTGARSKAFVDKNVEQPHDVSAMHIEGLPSVVSSTIGSNPLATPRAPLVTFSSKKTVPLLGGFVPEALENPPRPRVAVMPTSYTDLYAELGNLMPDCEQTAVCLICGEVLNAGGKGECTRHSYKCGAGAGMFFLLQECSGLIMHKSKAAYIHSPYVDSHGETPQYRGRPLNLDLDRYEHLRQVWYGHSVRQQVVAERGSSRQVIFRTSIDAA